MTSVPTSEPLPRLAIVIPVYGHSVLVGEAICTALAQEAPFPIRIVVVNDGCPNPETDLAVSTLAAAHSDRVTYLRKPNGGLSSARNFGIRHILKHLPSVEALFMLDADNRLRPVAMARAMAALDANPEVAWVYPSIDMFGIKARCDYGGPYSRLIHSQTNISEAGSLVRRSVFEKGVMFDESFTQGFEDWHFFLSAGDAGFRGMNLEDFGFFYRKRPESMLANSDRNVAVLAGVVRQAHEELYSPKTQLGLEQREAPRYAIFDPATDIVAFTTDPEHPGEQLTLESYVAQYWRSKTSPMKYRVPPFLTVFSDGLATALRERGALAWVLWRLEHATLANGLGYLTQAQAARPGGMGFETDATDTSQRRQEAVAWMIGPDALHDLLSDGATSDLAQQTPETRPAVSHTLRIDLDPDIPSAASPLDKILSSLHGSRFRAAGLRRWTWRQPSIALRGREYKVARKTFAGQPVFPRVASRNREIGLLASEPEHPTYRKVLDTLSTSRGRDVRLHMISPASAVSTVDRDRLDTVTLLCDQKTGQRKRLKSIFEELLLPEDPETPSIALAALHWLDELHNFDWPGGHHLMGPLRRFGLNTYLHLRPPRADAGSEDEFTYALAYEHAYDRIFVETAHLAEYLHARGIPRSKIEVRT